VVLPGVAVVVEVTQAPLLPVSSSVVLVRFVVSICRGNRMEAVESVAGPLVLPSSTCETASAALEEEPPGDVVQSMLSS
jgi:hypothetical protein